jgi:flagellar basal-body rod protein FlgB
MESLLGLPGKAIQVYEKRFTYLANNLANSSTPNYKATDLDFRDILKGENSATIGLDSVGGKSISTEQIAGQAVSVKYRTATQGTLDGNTVDPDIERAAFAENTLRYQASLLFLNSKASSILSAIKGE